MPSTIADACLDQLFRTARTHARWLDRPVEDATLREVYELLKWAPTSANSSPTRFVFLRSREARERLRPALAPGNVEKTMTAPMTVIVAYDLLFHEKLTTLWPQSPAMREQFAKNPQLIETTARRNSSLQGAYLILAARAVGLDCGPMSGFDAAQVDAEFFGVGREAEDCAQEFMPAGHVQSNFLVNLGYGDAGKVHPRNPRLAFEEACVVL